MSDVSLPQTTHCARLEQAMSLISANPAWLRLKEHVTEVEALHLRDLLQDSQRDAMMTLEFEGIFLDYSRQLATPKTVDLLFGISQMRAGDHINTSENRAVAHTALRANDQDKYVIDNVDVVPEVLAIRKKIQDFSERVRSGEWKGATGKPLTDVVAIGIGGSYLGGEFVSEALRTEPTARAASSGRRLRFLANVDPVDIMRSLDGLNPETTLAIIISKTFTTAETMLNARTVRQWFTASLGDSATRAHMVAVSTATPLVKAFGIDEANIFGFWEWVGGRYSVTSAVGLLPLALQYGFNVVQRFLDGARSMDQHFFSASPRANMPFLLGLLGVWNSTFLGHPARAIACYSQAMLKLAPHIQQVDMESNGKRVTRDGVAVDFPTGEINFGEPGTNGQHSFFQLLHQGRVVPVDFIGSVVSQNPVELKGEPVSNHDELMSNFFAQPDALACGKSAEELIKAGVPASEVPHRTMLGNRPSNVLLLQALDAYSIGQLLALYEHRTAVQGFVWGINSFDQMGVELGKVLAKNVREQMKATRHSQADIRGFNPSTKALLERYLTSKV